MRGSRGSPNRLSGIATNFVHTLIILCRTRTLTGADGELLVKNQLPKTDCTLQCRWNGRGETAFFFPRFSFALHERKKSLYPNRPGHLEFVNVQTHCEIHGRFGTGLRPVSIAPDPALSRKNDLLTPKTGNMPRNPEIRCSYWKPLPCTGTDDLSATSPTIRSM